MRRRRVVSVVEVSLLVRRVELSSRRVPQRHPLVAGRQRARQTRNDRRKQHVVKNASSNHVVKEVLSNQCVDAGNFSKYERPISSESEIIQDSPGKGGGLLVISSAM